MFERVFNRLVHGSVAEKNRGRGRRETKKKKKKNRRKVAVFF